MRVKTIKLGVGGIGAIAAYYATPEPDAGRPGRYYADPSEPAGRWLGSGCRAVGLAGRVETEQLERMLQARHPGDETRLGRGFWFKSARAFDATFAAPKSVSVLWALTDDPAAREQIVAAQDAAVAAALGWFEAHGNLTRRAPTGSTRSTPTASASPPSVSTPPEPSTRRSTPTQ